VKREKVKNINMSKKQTKIRVDNSNSKLEGQVIGCSEIFTLDSKGNILKKE